MPLLKYLIARACAGAVAGVACLGLWAAQAVADPFSFVLLGDQPYGSDDATLNLHRSLIAEINRQDPALVIHVGDTKSGASFCTDAMLAGRLDLLNEFGPPVLYTPGDNEWTDCHRLIAGNYEPEERLAHLRATYFADPGTSFGQNPVNVAHQGDAGYPENTRLEMDGIMFVTAHVVGSNNNFEATRPSAATEFAARDAANRQWLKQSFEAASDSKALVLALHANMFKEGFKTELDPEGFHRSSGFRPFVRNLVWLAGQFGRPVLLIHGDGHRFGMFRPFRQKAPNIMVLETFGADHMHAVRVHVTPEDPYPFAIHPLLNPDQPMR